jgi:dATP pyrophosphohydrolase
MISVVAIRGTGAGAQVLLLHRATAHLHGLWTYVAGHVEPGEKAWQAAVRELREEAGLRPQALYSADRCETYYDVREECIAVVPAFVAFVDNDATVQRDGENDAHRWLPLDEAIPLLPFGGQRELFEQIHRDFIESPPPSALRIPLGDTGAQDPEVGTMGATPE